MYRLLRRRLSLLLAIAVVAATALLLVWIRRPVFEVHVRQQPADDISASPRSSGCLSGVVTVVPGGRLGNYALQYASAWAVAKSFHLRLAAPSAMLGRLSGVFPQLSAAPLRQLLAVEAECNMTEQQLLSQPNKVAEVGEVPGQVERATSAGEPVVLRRFIVLGEYFAPLAEELRKEFRFLPQLEEAALSKLQQAKQEVSGIAGCNSSRVCTVGVHVRRTDYAKYLRSRFGLRSLANESFFTNAATVMQQDLREECSAIAFIVSSDDSRWCRKYLLPALNSVFKESTPPSAAFEMSSHSVEADLCLLSSCQHSILSYGTFSSLVGLMAGGRAIVYDVTAHGSSKGNSLMNIAKHMGPTWKLLP